MLHWLLWKLLFGLLFEALPAMSQVCGGASTNETGTIISPNYPFGYSNDLKCVWTIEVPVGKALKIVFLADSYIEYAGGCYDDALWISDIHMNPPHAYRKLCGYIAAGTEVVTSSRRLTITLSTDRATVAAGFSLEWTTFETKCGEKYNAQSGVLRAPHYPSTYPEMLDCTSTIEVDDGYVIELHFPDETVIQYDLLCDYDDLSIFDDSINPPHTYRKLCGVYDAGLNVTTSSKKLNIRFRTNHAVNYPGWYMEWNVIPTQCGEEFINDTGALTSPGYPSNYPEMLSCYWRISVSAGKVIVITFPDLINIESYTRCSHDRLKFIDYTRNAPHTYRTICGRYPANYTIVTSSQNLTVEFATDKSLSYFGWSFQWTAIETKCGETFTGSHGTLTAPNYPFTYPEVLDCQWTIKVEGGHAIQIFFPDDYLIEQYTNCYRDSLRIIDYSMNPPHTYATYCGNIYAGTRLVTSSQELSVVFSTTESLSYDGWMFEWRSFDTRCGETFTGTSGTLSAPNYPFTYPDMFNCWWYIEVPAGRAIELTFSETASIQHYTGCYRDALKFYDGSYPKTHYRTLCGKIEAGTKIVTTSNKLDVHFETNGKIGFNGWSFDWNVIQCGDGPDPETTDTCERRRCDSITEDECNSCPIIRDTCCHTCESFKPTTPAPTMTTCIPTSSTTPMSTTTDSESTSATVAATAELTTPKETTTTMGPTTTNMCQDEPNFNKCVKLLDRCANQVKRQKIRRCKADCKTIGARCCETCCNLYSEFC